MGKIFLEDALWLYDAKKNITYRAFVGNKYFRLRSYSKKITNDGFCCYQLLSIKVLLSQTLRLGALKRKRGYQAKTLQWWQSSDVCSKQGRVEKHGEEGLVVDGNLAGHTMVCAPEHVGDPLRQMYKYLQIMFRTRHRNTCTYSFAPDVQIFVNNQNIGRILPLIAKEKGTCMTRQHWMKSSKHTACRPVLSNLRSRRRYTWENTWIHLGAQKGAGIFR